MISIPLFAAFALMTALAALAVLWPLSRVRAVKATREADLAVYRDQLAEIARDAKAGRLPAAEAEAARVEVARRMLAADAAGAAEAGAEDATRAAGSRRTAAVAGLVFVPAMAATLYVLLGSPGLPGAPLADRLSAAPERSDLAMLVRKLEDHLARNPDDGRGFEIIAPIYLRMGRADDAVRAYGVAIRTLGPTALRYSMLGEAMVAGSEGLVTADAARAFSEALKLDPEEPGAAYYLGLAAQQDGRDADAARIWGDLLARMPADSPNRPMLMAKLAKVAGAPAGSPASPAQKGPRMGAPMPAAGPGPGAADVAAAAAMSTQDREAMVRSMVTRLAERLAGEPNDLEGWLRLMRAYTVLGEKEKVAEALKSARAAFKDNAEALGRLDAAEKELAGGGKG